MLKSETRVIDGNEWTVTQFAGQRNFEILLDLMALVGPALSAAANSSKGSGSIMDAEINIGAVAEMLFAKLSKDTVKPLVMRMLASTFRSGRQINDSEFDAAFAGTDIWSLPKVLGFVIEHNYGNFSNLAGSISSLHARSQGAAGTSAS